MVLPWFGDVFVIHVSASNLQEKQTPQYRINVGKFYTLRIKSAVGEMQCTPTGSELVVAYALGFAGSPPACAVMRFDGGEYRKPDIIPHIPTVSGENLSEIFTVYREPYLIHRRCLHNQLIHLL